MILFTTLSRCLAVSLSRGLAVSSAHGSMNMQDCRFVNRPPWVRNFECSKGAAQTVSPRLIVFRLHVYCTFLLSMWQVVRRFMQACSRPLSCVSWLKPTLSWVLTTFLSKIIIVIFLASWEWDHCCSRPGETAEYLSWNKKLGLQIGWLTAR